MFDVQINIDTNESKFQIINVDADIIKGDIIINKEPTNEIYEVISGKLKIYRTVSENISLTDKCEFFRFLPIKRNNIVYKLRLYLTLF